MPEDVFTPRSRDINQRTYAKRPLLEDRLVSALKGSKYIILRGESGNGKTWLYKQILRQMKLTYEVVNLAQMQMEGSLSGVLLAKLGELGRSDEVGTKSEADAGFRPGGMGGGIKTVTEYKTLPIGILAQIAQEMNKKAGKKKSILVLDNFEQIIDNEAFVRQVAGLIISADDDYVSQYNMKVLLVGTPSNIKDMISKVSNATTISNRFIEIPEVARMEATEARDIMSKGFETHLDLTILVDKNQLYSQISFKTDRIAQHIQELCLKIATRAYDSNRKVTQEIVESAEAEWIDETLSSDRSVIESVMNPIGSRVGRKNQVLYCLGVSRKEDFKSTDVEKMVQETFDVDTGINLNISQILSKFASARTPILRKLPKGGYYRFSSPKLRMAIRAMLKLNGEKQVVNIHPAV